MIIFFIRRYNDLDHIVPIVYKLATQKKGQIKVICQNPFFDFQSDYRIKYLNKNFNNVETDYLYNFYKKNFMYKIFSYYLSNCHRSLNNIIYLNKGIFRGEIIVLILVLFVKRFFYRWVYDDILKTKIYNLKWSLELFKKLKPELILFDHIKPNQYLTKHLVDASNLLKIPVITVPHGVTLFKNGYAKGVKDVYKNELKFGIDKVIVSNKTSANHRMDNGFSQDKLIVLGSARFCHEWIKIHNQILPKEEIKLSPDKKVKIVYFERGRNLHGKYTETIKNTLNAISELDFVHLVIKPHTRSSKLHFNFAGNVQIASSTNSVNLIRWSDAVVGTVSSILIEAFIQDKTFIYPKYFHDDEMIFEEYNACWSVENKSELIESLTTLKSKKNYKAYTQSNVDELFKNIIYADEDNSDVLGRYIDLIEVTKKSFSDFA